MYAYYIGDKKDIVAEEKLLFSNIEKLYNLEIYLLSTIFEMRDIAEEEIEEGKNKFYPTEEEKNPNMRFVENPMFRLMHECEQLQDGIKKLKINWVEEKTLLRSIFDHFKGSESYKTYMSKDYVSLKTIERLLFSYSKTILLKTTTSLMNLQRRVFLG